MPPILRPEAFLLRMLTLPLISKDSVGVWGPPVLIPGLGALYFSTSSAIEIFLVTREFSGFHSEWRDISNWGRMMFIALILGGLLGDRILRVDVFPRCWVLRFEFKNVEITVLLLPSRTRISIGWTTSDSVELRLDFSFIISLFFLWSHIRPGVSAFCLMKAAEKSRFLSAVQWGGTNINFFAFLFQKVVFELYTDRSTLILLDF